MGTFKKTTTIKGTFKNIVLVNGRFVDFETGEVIDIAEILYSIYGDMPFDIATTLKSDVEMTPEEE